MMRVEGWGKAKISHFGEIITGSTPDTKNLNYWGGDIPFVSPADFSSSIFVYKTDKTLTEQGAKQARIVPEKSILVTCIGSIGGIAIVPRYCVTNQQINSVVCKENFDALFVYYLIRNNLFRLQELAGTTTLPIINKSTFSDIDLIYPKSKSEQEQIAAVLSTIDRAIAQTEAIIAKQQRIKTGLMQDLLTKGIDEHGNIRSEATHEFKDSAIGRIPVEWEVENFIDACERVSVGIATSTTKYFQSEGVPLLRNQNILSGVFDLNELLYISLDFDAINKSKRLKTGDLVTMRTGYPGRTSVTTSFMDGWQTFTTLISTPKKSKYRPDFLSVLMNSCVCRKQILTLQCGGAQQNLNVGWLIKMKVFKPSIAEQTGILSVLNNIEKVIDSSSKQLQKLHHQKTGLMQDLLTGKVRVTELLKEREPASP